jgi:hypothetical protein
MSGSRQVIADGTLILLDFEIECANYAFAGGWCGSGAFLQESTSVLLMEYERT